MISWSAFYALVLMNYYFPYRAYVINGPLACNVFNLVLPCFDIFFFAFLKQNISLNSKASSPFQRHVRTYGNALHTSGLFFSFFMVSWGPCTLIASIETSGPVCSRNKNG